MGMLLREEYFSSVCQPVCIFTPHSKGPLKILISTVNGEGDTAISKFTWPWKAGKPIFNKEMAQCHDFTGTEHVS